MPPAGDASVAELSDALYIAAGKAAVDDAGARSRVFSQDELMHLAQVSNAKELMPLIGYLTNNHLFRTQKSSGRLLWSVRPRDAARQIKMLERDEKTIYEIIEESHTDGIWIKNIRNKSGLAQNIIAKAVTRMEKAMLVKNVKSVRGPTQKIYMLFHLVPSEEVSGNSFFDAGDLDESFRDELMNLIIFWVRQQSWSEVKRRVNKPAITTSSHSAPTAIMIPDDAIIDSTDPDLSVPLSPKSKKRKASHTADIEDSAAPPSKRAMHSYHELVQIPYPVGTHHYPTTRNVHDYLSSSPAIKETKAKSLTVQEIQDCINILVWDDKLEKVGNFDDVEPGYRTVKGVTFKTPETMYSDMEQGQGTGLTQSPCGRCPVFDLCSADGPINPTDCTYYEDWLKS